MSHFDQVVVSLCVVANSLIGSVCKLKAAVKMSMMLLCHHVVQYYNFTSVEKNANEKFHHVNCFPRLPYIFSVRTIANYQDDLA